MKTQVKPLPGEANQTDTQVDLRLSKTRWSKGILARRLLWTLLGQPWLFILPRPLNRLNAYILRAFGARLGKRCLVMPGVKVLQPWNLVVGDFCAIGRGVDLYNHAAITIGDMTVVSQYAFLCTGTHDFRDKAMPLQYHPISIGSQCWIAAGAFLAPGVQVGDGAVVGARAVVVKDVAAWTVVAGNPARAVSTREIRSD